MTYPSGKPRHRRPPGWSGLCGAIQTLKIGGLLTGAEAANEVAYNNRLQPIETRLRTGGSALNLSRLEYFYCPAQLLSCTTNNGNLRSQRISHEAVGSEPVWTTLQQYGYDQLNRLTAFTDGAATETNNYDPWGNRWATVSGLTPSPLTPGDASWFNPGNNRISNLGYDEVGNQTQVNPYTLTYDGEGHVTSVASASNGSAAYAYDADGRRVTKTIGTNVTAFVYDAFGQLAAEYGPSTGTAGLQFQMADHLGSTRVVTDAAGAVIRRHDYRPFGEDLTGVSGRSSKYGDTLNVLRFTGKERDAETGLDYFGARYMSSAQGRFTSTDPKESSRRTLANPQKWNKYAYVLNNPLALVDPDGMEEVRIQFRAFIPQANIGGFRGDNRSFSANQNASSRVAVTVRIETDPSRNRGNPLLSTDTKVSSTHFNLTGGDKTSTGPMMPAVSATQDKNGNVTVNVQENVRNPFTPIGGGIQSNVNITVNQGATNANISGTISGSPSFEANLGVNGGETQNVPLQAAPTGTLQFGLGLQQTIQINRAVELKKKKEEE